MFHPTTVRLSDGHQLTATFLREERREDRVYLYFELVISSNFHGNINLIGAVHIGKHYGDICRLESSVLPPESYFENEEAYEQYKEVFKDMRIAKVLITNMPFFMDFGSNTTYDAFNRPSLLGNFFYHLNGIEKIHAAKSEAEAISHIETYLDDLDWSELTNSIQFTTKIITQKRDKKKYKIAIDCVAAHGFPRYVAVDPYLKKYTDSVYCSSTPLYKYDPSVLLHEYVELPSFSTQVKEIEEREREVFLKYYDREKHAEMWMDWWLGGTPNKA